MDNVTMSDENMPPWDINRVSQNPIDHKFVFTQPLDIFSMTQNSTQPSIQTTQQLNKAPIHSTQDSNKIPKTTKETQIESTEAIALALKYRPKTFAELVGQESVARTLCLALDSKKIANAYLFSGLRGSGKTSSARILARSLQCEKGITSSPCGVCANCIAALKGSHLDITELDGASNRKIDDMRDLIEQTKYKPTMGRFKIFIIDEVHMLTKEAFNSLLKTLEEPPNYVKFILATTDPLKVPATILSRTQHFRFKKIPTTALKNHLAHILQKEHVSSDEASLDMLIRNGHGSLRDTLTLLDQAIVFCQNSLTTQKLADMLGALDPSAFDTLFQALLRKDMQECVKFAKSLEGYEIEMILDELSLYIKNKMLEEIPQIPPVLGMRYAIIINDSKAMLQLDCDSDFCLLLTILKMLEAQKIREVANALKQLESMQTPAQRDQIAQLSNEYIATQNNMESKSILQADSINSTTQNTAQPKVSNQIAQNLPNPQNLAQDSSTFESHVLTQPNQTQHTITESNTKDSMLDSSNSHNIADPTSIDSHALPDSNSDANPTQHITQYPSQMQSVINPDAPQSHAIESKTTESKIPQPSHIDINQPYINEIRDSQPENNQIETNTIESPTTESSITKPTPQSLPNEPIQENIIKNSIPQTQPTTNSSTTLESSNTDSISNINVSRDPSVYSNPNSTIDSYVSQDSNTLKNPNVLQDSNILTESSHHTNATQEHTAQNTPITESIQTNTQTESNTTTQQSPTDSIHAQQESNKQPFSLTKNDSLFITLIAKLYERDYNIGSLFENKIAFDKLIGNVLHLIFYTTEEETSILRQAYSGIMQVMKEIYGDSIKMQVVKQSPQDLTKLMQNTTTRATQATQNLSETTDNNPTHTQQTKPQNLNTENSNQAMNADPAMQFIAQNSDMLKSMQNELGIKDMKVISLPVSTILQ